jgi:adenine-specific DNA-methyltransferase
MPTLNWIGKDKIVNHHRDVPFHTLQLEYNFNSDTVSENKIIQGDNLLALKSLLPEYEGRIKCIYIDPPYNTGNEGWVYNDNVSDPRLKRWLDKVVGKEGEDLSRHDKWLCMMYPRLQLLRRLLADDGAIFISIDDNEQANLKLMCDEIFGGGNFVAPLIWKSRQNVDARNKSGISNDHEYILVYRKKDLEAFQGVEKDLTKFSNPDNDERGAWRSADLTGIATKDQRPNLHYDLLDPETNLIYSSPEKGWRYDRNTMQKKIQEKRILFPKSIQGRPRNKIFMNEMESENKAFSTVILEMNTGQGTKNLKEIFGQDIFAFPKPVNLIEFLLSQISSKNDLILDSFAGSGTTAHAVLNLNAKDGGNRKFILVEMNDYAETITAERVRRVIAKQSEVKEAATDQISLELTENEAIIPASFSYYSLDEKLFDPEYGDLNEAAPLTALQSYIWYSETLTPYAATPSGYYLGEHFGTGYVFAYEKGATTVLDESLLEMLKNVGSVRNAADVGKYVIYADICLLPDALLRKQNIVFKKIPRQIIRI